MKRMFEAVLILAIIVDFNVFASPMVKLDAVSSGYMMELNVPEPVIDKEVVNTIDRNGTAINETFDHVSIAGYGYYGEEGGPALVSSSFQMALEDTAPQIEISDIVTEKIPLEHRPYPVQPMSCTCGKCVNPAFAYSPAIYQQSKRTGPEEYVTVADLYTFRGQKAAMISVKPTSYDPVTNTITVLKKALVTFKMKRPTVVHSWNSREFDKIMRAMFANLDNVPAERFLAKEKFLIITQTEYKENADLKRFIDYKSKFYDMKLVGIADVGGTTKDNFRTFVRNEKPTFCVLVGKSPTFPTHSVKWDAYTAQSYEYYGATQIASGTKRPLPDIAIGLFYVSSAAEITNIVDKTLKTEQNLSTMPKIFIGQGGNTAAMGTLPAVHCDSVVANVANLYFPSSSGFQNTVYFSTKNEGNAAKAIEWFNKGIRFYGYNGHGGNDGPVYGFKTSSLSSMTNTIYPFAQISACYTGTFDKTCGAVSALVSKNGPVTYIGSYEPSSMGQHVLSRGYFEAIMVKKITKSGLAFVYAINSDSTFPCITKYMGQVDETMKAWCAWQYHHFGDPSIETMNPLNTPIETEMKTQYPAYAIRMQGASIHFNIPDDRTGSSVTIQLYNAQGRLIKTLLNEKMQSGAHTVSVSGIVSGCYMVSVKINGFARNMNMLYVK